MDQDPEFYDDEFDEEDNKDSFDAYLKERGISVLEYDAMDEEDQATLRFDWGPIGLKGNMISLLFNIKEWAIIKT